MPSFRAIAHPTDFSEASAEAFAHALRIALNAKCPLHIMHVHDPEKEDEWAAFPHIRETLAKWGLIDAREPPEAIYKKLGVKVVKVEIETPDKVAGILHFMHEHPADLIVLATAGRRGIAQWLKGSLAEALARAAKTPALFVQDKARGFIDAQRGEVQLLRVLIPVDHNPKPAAAISAIMGLAHLLGGGAVEERLMHVGKDAPQIQRRVEPGRSLPVTLRKGNVVDAVIAEANNWPADLIGMPTAGHHGFFDALRGSTSERMLRQAPCPVLAVPAGD
jgi:nucleotide-binding universal stress UspA family protein